MINICYSGSLDGFDPQNRKYRKNFLRDMFWSFNNRNVNSTTRSGYFLIEAICQLRDERKITKWDVHVHLWGNIDYLNYKQVEQNNLKEFFTIDKYLPKTISLEKMKMADVLFLPLERANTKMHKTLFIPGKLFEYLSAMKPILALCENSDCRDIIEKSGLGICVSPDNIDEIKESILKIVNERNYLENFKPNKDYIESFSFINKTKELTAVFDQLMP